MDFFNGLSGMIEVEIISADPAMLLAALGDAGITVHHVRQKDDVTICLCTPRSQYRKILHTARRRGEGLRILHRSGLYWGMKRLLHRPVLWVGLSMLMILLLYLPSRILFIQVEGNLQIPSRLILEAAEGCGIRFGASRREVRSERVKNALLHQVPQLQWAGVNTYGCVAVVSVRERSMAAAEEEKTEVSSIVALRDGIVTSCSATNGNLLCRPGQAVRAGEVLISGYTDCGLSIRATSAEGEVYARTKREISLISPAVYIRKAETGGMKRNISLIFGKKRINLWKDSGISTITCDRIYEEYYVTLPGGFQLPVALSVEEFRVFEPEEALAEEQCLRQRMEASAVRHVREQMVAGTIGSQSVSFLTDGECVKMAGEYICTEMIGKVRREQIGDTNGESD